MEDQYRMPDLLQYISGQPIYPLPPPPQLTPPDLLLNQPNPYDMLVFRSDSKTNNSGAAGGGASSSAAVGGGFSGFDFEGVAGVSGGGGGRWPRQETLTLLEIRSRLDLKFKEANQKGPLWDEVSRLMSEENGYQRNGKKCREKFENLYKYYKKTKDGKAGRQDGKHYRFFRQLEALYGETNNLASASNPHLHYNNPNKNTCLANYNNQDSFPGSKISDTSLSLSNLSDSDTTSSDDSGHHNVGIDDNDSKKNKKRCKRGWKIKIKDFIDGQMRKLINKQEIWMEKIMKTIEQKEQERILREEEWRKQDAARIEMEHKLWDSERAWIEARDSALMEAFHKMSGKEIRVAQQETMTTTTAIRSHESSICNKKRKENSKGLNYFENHHESNICNIQAGEGGGYCDTSERGGDYAIRLNEQGGDHTIRLTYNDHLNSNPNGNNSISDSCFRYFMGDGFGRIMD